MVAAALPSTSSGTLGSVTGAPSQSTGTLTANGQVCVSTWQNGSVLGYTCTPWATSATGSSNVAITTTSSPGIPTFPKSNSTTDGPKSERKEAGIPGGAVAGVAIGCLLAGAIIAAIVCFLLYRRKHHRQPTSYYQHHASYTSEQKPGAAVVTVAAAGTKNIDSLLPQPVEDATITTELSRIRDNIKNHVQTFYHVQPAHTRVDSSKLEGLATATGFSSTVLADMLADSATRSDAIRLFIAWAILSRTESGGQSSLLPLELGSAIDSMQVDPRDTSKDMQGPIILTRNDRGADKSAMLSKWKVLTGVLLDQRYRGGSLDAQQAVVIIEDMNSVLGLFVQSGSDGGKRHRNLEMILGRAAKLAFLLFSQPGSFRFDFSGGRKDSVVVFPSILQVTGDDGEKLSPPRSLCQKEFGADY